MPGIRLAALVRKLRGNDTPDLGGRSDADLLARFAANRDEAAFELLVWRHGAMVLAASRRVLGHNEDAEDAFQAAFLVLARKAGSVRSSVPAWLHRVSVRIALKLARKRRPAAVLEIDPVARAGPDAAELGELRGVLDSEIDRLSEPCRRAFVLCYLEGLSNADAARLMGCPVGTIESRLTSARKKLRDRLSRRKVELPAGVLALLGAQSGLAKEVVATVARAGVTNAERGVKATIGIVREPAAKVAQGVLVMTKLRAWAGVTLGVALIGLAAGVGWANLPADPPPVVPELASAEPEVAPQPKPIGEPAAKADAWPLAKQIMDLSWKLIGVAPDGKSLLVHEDNAVAFVPLVHNTDTPRVVSRNTILAAALSPDGKYLATAEGVNGVKLREVATGNVVEAIWPSGDLPAEKVAFSPDGSKLIALCSRSDSPIRAKGAKGDRPPGSFPPGTSGATPGSGALRVLGSPGGGVPGQRVKVTNLTRVSVWDLTTRKEIGHPVQTDTAESSALPIYTLAGNGRFILKTEGISEKNAEGLLTPKGRRFTTTDAVTGKADKTMDVAQASLGQIPPDPLSPDGTTLVMIDSATRADLRFFDLATGKDKFRVPAFRRPIKAVTFSPDGKLVAAATGRTAAGPQGDSIAAPSEVVIWNAATGKELARLVDKESIRDYTALRFSADGSYLVAQSTSGGGKGMWGSLSGGELTIWGNPPQPEKRKAPVPAKAPRPPTSRTASRRCLLPWPLTAWRTRSGSSRCSSRHSGGCRRTWSGGRSCRSSPSDPTRRRR